MMASAFAKYVLVVKIDALLNNYMLIHLISILLTSNNSKNGMFKKHLALSRYQVKYIMGIRNSNHHIKEIILLKKHQNHKLGVHRNLLSLNIGHSPLKLNIIRDLNPMTHYQSP